jgi:hypothetical protein
MMVHRLRDAPVHGHFLRERTAGAGACDSWMAVAIRNCANNQQRSYETDDNPECYLHHRVERHDQLVSIPRAKLRSYESCLRRRG